LTLWAGICYLCTNKPPRTRTAKSADVQRTFRNACLALPSISAYLAVCSFATFHFLAVSIATVAWQPRGFTRERRANSTLTTLPSYHSLSTAPLPRFKGVTTSLLYRPPANVFMPRLRRRVSNTAYLPTPTSPACATLHTKHRLPSLLCLPPRRYSRQKANLAVCPALTSQRPDRLPSASVYDVLGVRLAGR